jgi:3-dehydroquinate synthase II
MKELWVDLRQWNHDLATTALESGADVVVIGEAEKIRELGRITTVAPDGDLVPDRDVFFMEISGKESEKEAVSRSRKGYVVVETRDWTVIPLENLVSLSDRIIATVTSPAEAAIALGVLERGVRGVLVRTESPDVIRKIAAMVKESGISLRLIPFTITRIAPAGLGDRVCVDTCSLLQDGEGLLVGNTSSAFLLVHAETLENPYVAPRPFRVNAGAVHAYVLAPGEKTAYLSEVALGDSMLVVDASGETREATVGRVKVEKRPLLLIEAEAEGERASIVLQNAETIRLVAEDGSARSVVGLEKGDRVLGYSTRGGRHLGVAVEETILEK